MPSLFDNSGYNFQLPIVTPTTPSSIGAVNPNIGMNAGYVQPTNYYTPTNPVQSKYNWAPRAQNTPQGPVAQPGEQAWGVQKPAPTFDVNKFIQQMLSPQQQQMDTSLPTNKK